MARYFIEIEFNGSDFSGWQLQPEANTIEGAVEQAFETILQRPIDLVGQGRTDAGVHATAQIAHVDLAENDLIRLGQSGTVGKKYDAEILLLLHRANRMLSPNVFLRSMRRVKEEAHARFDALSRCYEYRVLIEPSPILAYQAWYPGFKPDLEQLKPLATALLGEHDFDAISKTNPDNFTTICTIYESSWTLEGKVLVYRVKANRFLRNMVRRLVGSMVQLVRGNDPLIEHTIEMIAGNQLSTHNPDYLWIEQLKDHQKFTAPAEALYLVAVDYASDCYTD